MMARIPGEFVPLDVNYSHDRAIRQAGYQAELLFIRGLTYARKMHKVTHGLIPDYDLAAIATGIPNPKKAAAALVRERLWIPAKGGWHIRSFGKWNPEIDRAAQSTGGALGNHNRWHSDGRWSPDCAFCGGPQLDELGISSDIGTESVGDRYTDEERYEPDIGTESPTDRFGSQRERERREEEITTSTSPQVQTVTHVTREPATLGLGADT